MNTHTERTRSIHRLLPQFPRRSDEQVAIALAGCGGTGSRMLPMLAELDQACLAWGLPRLHVQVYDPDIVSEANVGRQRFAPAHIGSYKAVTIVSMVNAFYGSSWGATPQPFIGRPLIDRGPFDILITTVDTTSARRRILEEFRKYPKGAPLYWLDCGNEKSTGQVVIGTPGRERHEFASMGLPTVFDLFPWEFGEDVQDSDEPSCTLAEALGKQDLGVNTHMAAWGVDLLRRLMKFRELDRHGYFLDMDTPAIKPIWVWEEEAETDVLPEGEADRVDAADLVGASA